MKPYFWKALLKQVGYDLQVSIVTGEILGRGPGSFVDLILAPVYPFSKFGREDIFHKFFTIHFKINVKCILLYCLL